MNYTYFKTGDASNISIRDVGDVDANGKQIVHDLALYYVRNGMLALAYSTQWAENPPQGGPWAFGTVVTGSMQAIEAREFRYESPRGRYLSRKLRVQTVQGSSPENPCFEVDPSEPAAWTDYVGDTPFTDYTVVNNGQGQPLVTTQTRHFLQSEQPASGEKRYFHADLVGSANLATNETGTPLPAGSGIAKIAYTAFGEEIALPGGAGTGKDAMPTRYRYVGGYGYESDLLTLDGKPGSQAVVLQHVGHRWYQASIGRFVQRDPAGLRRGLNLYSYCASQPVSRADPSGLYFVDRGGAEQGIFPGTPEWRDHITRPGGQELLIPLLGVVVLAGGGSALTTGMAGPGEVVLVTRWGSPIESGRWVMIGGANVWNYLLSGKWAPWWFGGYMPTWITNSFSMCVSKANLQSPSGLDFWKAWIGQRIYYGP
ncbi:MAG: RHS repeat-associated core domain-containing protein [Phycisphaerae bacterium]